MPESDSAGEMLLADLRDLFDGTDRLASTEIVKSLAAKEERQWAEWKHGRALTTIQLARLLKRFDVSPRTIKFGATAAKGYFREQFEKLWSQYLPFPDGIDPLPRNHTTSTPSERDSDPLPDPSLVTGREWTEPAPIAAGYGVTGREGVSVRGIAVSTPTAAVDAIPARDGDETGEPMPTSDSACPCGGRLLRWDFGTVCTSCHRRFQSEGGSEVHPGPLRDFLDAEVRGRGTS
jgi:hypothetical protein